MKANIQTIVLATLAITSVHCLTIPSSFEKTAALLERTAQEQQQNAYDGSQQAVVGDGNREEGYPLVSTSIINKELDELETEEKTLVLAASVYDNLAPLVQLAGALPDKKPIEGITKMKSGYSKVTTTTVAAAAAAAAVSKQQQAELSTDIDSSSSSSAVDSTDKAEDVVDVVLETSTPSDGALGKSIEKSKETGVVGGGGDNKYHSVVDEEEDEEDVETLVPALGNLSQFSPNLSAKESLAIFMRQQVYDASQSAGGSQGASSPGSQPMAAKLTINDDASSVTGDPEHHTHMREEMEKRLAAFMEKFMSHVLQAKMHEVRVEQRANGLQDYSLGSKQTDTQHKQH